MKTSTITATTVLIAGFLGGIAGGAYVLSDDGSTPPREVSMGQVGTVSDAAEAPGVLSGDAAGSDTGDAIAEPTPTPAAVASDPAPTQEAPVASKTETAQQAADRAEAAAKRAESAADKAEATPTPAPAVSAPVATPAPTPIPVVERKPSCEEGQVYGIGRSDEQVCRNGQLVSAAPNRHCKFGGTTPSYVESGTTTTRTIGGKEFTYKCEDGTLTLVDQPKS